MKRFMILTAAALISSGAFAQTATVEFAPEQRTKIKQYVTTQNGDRPAPPDTLAPVSRVSSWDFDGLRGLFGVVTAAPD